MPSMPGSFTRDLTLGSSGSDVTALQKFLNSHGFMVAASGPGSAGMETTLFGGMTKAALAKFQAAHGIMPASGYFGPKTRAAVAGM
jgi:peptidoglycan hydrolase-like protein with peptidoglycan-binding domain